MSIKDFKVNATAVLHLRDANDALMYEGTVPGEVEGEEVPDVSKPIRVRLYGPGSKQHAKASTKQSNLFMAKLKRKGGNVDQTPQERAEEQANYLADCTAGFDNMVYEDRNGTPLEGRELSLAVYADAEIGFIADQVQAYLKEWGNFSKTAQAS